MEINNFHFLTNLSNSLYQIFFFLLHLRSPNISRAKEIVSRKRNMLKKHGQTVLFVGIQFPLFSSHRKEKKKKRKITKRNKKKEMAKKETDFRLDANAAQFIAKFSHTV